VTPPVTPTSTTTPSITPSITPTRTASVTPSITPSTSRIPVTLSVTPSCDSPVFDGNGRVYANAFNGGTNSFDYISLSSISAADALSKLDNPATRTFIGGATEYNFTSLSNATYYVAIMDTAGNKGVSSAAVVSCIAPSPTPSVTPSVTRTPSITSSPTPSVTPSITPSVTPSVTPDPTPCPSSSPAATTVTIQIATNNSLDIEIYLSSITVNGVGVTNITGVDPNTPGNGATVDTDQIGTYDIVVVYSATISGQNISLVDSNGTPYCNNTSTGFNSMTFSNVVINGSVNPVLTAGDGTCI